MLLKIFKVNLGVYLQFLEEENCSNQMEVDEEYFVINLVEDLRSQNDEDMSTAEIPVSAKTRSTRIPPPRLPSIRFPTICKIT